LAGLLPEPSLRFSRTSSGGIVGAMHMLDVLAAILVVGATVAFTFGAMMLARASDVEAIYYLIVGVVALRAGVQLVRPGASA
jgi:hypothetical protein